MAPKRKAVDGREAVKLVRETLEDKYRAKVKTTRNAAVEANQRHVAATGKPMPQGGKHRKKNRG